MSQFKQTLSNFSHTMQVLIAATLVTAFASNVWAKPYLASGWKPDGPAFYLPGELKPSESPLKDTTLADISEDVIEYGPPKLTQVLQDLSLQELPDIKTNQAFNVKEFSRISKGKENNSETTEESNEPTVVNYEIKEVNVRGKEENIVSLEDNNQDKEVNLEAINRNLEVLEINNQDKEVNIEVKNENIAILEENKEDKDINLEARNKNLEVLEINNQDTEISIEVKNKNNEVLEDNKEDKDINLEAKNKNLVVIEDNLYTTEVSTETNKDNLGVEFNIDGTEKDQEQLIITTDEAIRKSNDNHAEQSITNDNEVAATETIENVINNLENIDSNLKIDIKAEKTEFQENNQEPQTMGRILELASQEPEGFLEYGPPGFKEYGPPKLTDLERSVVLPATEIMP